LVGEVFQGSILCSPVFQACLAEETQKTIHVNKSIIHLAVYPRCILSTGQSALCLRLVDCWKHRIRSWGLASRRTLRSRCTLTLQGSPSLSHDVTLHKRERLKKVESGTTARFSSKMEKSECQLAIERERTLQSKERTEQLRIELKIRELTSERETNRHGSDVIVSASKEIRTEHARDSTDSIQAKLAVRLPSVHTVFYKKQMYYKVNDIASVLGYRDCKRAGKQHIPAELRFSGADIGFCSNGNEALTTYTTEEGAATLLHLSRLPNSVEIAEAVGIQYLLRISNTITRHTTLPSYCGRSGDTRWKENIQWENT
jgi:hypothetical protein